MFLSCVLIGSWLSSKVHEDKQYYVRASRYSFYEEVYISLIFTKHTWCCISVYSCFSSIRYRSVNITAEWWLLCRNWVYSRFLHKSLLFSVCLLFNVSLRNKYRQAKHMKCCAYMKQMSNQIFLWIAVKTKFREESPEHSGYLRKDTKPIVTKEHMNIDCIRNDELLLEESILKSNHANCNVEAGCVTVFLRAIGRGTQELSLSKTHRNVSYVWDHCWYS